MGFEKDVKHFFCSFYSFFLLEHANIDCFIGICPWFWAEA